MKFCRNLDARWFEVSGCRLSSKQIIERGAQHVGYAEKFFSAHVRPILFNLPQKAFRYTGFLCQLLKRKFTVRSDQPDSAAYRIWVRLLWHKVCEYMHLQPIMAIR
jgi:hypothetical protein